MRFTHTTRSGHVVQRVDNRWLPPAPTNNEARTPARRSRYRPLVGRAAGRDRTRKLRMSRRRSIAAPFAVAMAVVLSAVSGCGGNSASPPLKATPLVQASGLGRCSTAVAHESPIAGATTSMLQIGGMPFAVVVSPDGDWSFVSLGGQVAVLSARGATPRLVREIPLPQQTGGFGRAA